LFASLLLAAVAIPVAAQAQADLVVTKTGTPDPVLAGSNLIYTITVTNDGPDAAADVTLTDDLPASTAFVSFTAPAGWTATTPATGGTGTITAANPSLAAGATGSFTLVITINSATPGGAVVTNTATIGSSTADPDPDNNSSKEVVDLAVLRADLAVSESDSQDPILAGNNLAYTVAVINNGPNDAGDVTLTDVIPANTTFVSFTAPAGWTVTTPAVGGTGTVTAINPSLAAAVTGSFTLVLSVNPGTWVGGMLTNTATIASSTTDPDPGNNSATETTDVRSPQADLAVTKAGFPNPVAAGGNITYTMAIANAGPDAAADVTLTDVLPNGTTFVSFAAPAGWTVTTPAVGGSGTITASNASLAGATVSGFTLVVSVNAGTSLGAVITNTVTVASSTPDPAPADNSATSTAATGLVNAAALYSPPDARKENRTPGGFLPKTCARPAPASRSDHGLEGAAEVRSRPSRRDGRLPLGRAGGQGERQGLRLPGSRPDSRRTDGPLCQAAGLGKRGSRPAFHQAHGLRAGQVWLGQREFLSEGFPSPRNSRGLDHGELPGRSS
jgi:uncharacterized repeat protein (TIGR01451 family)